MTEARWLPFVYRDFYDVPHALVVERGGRSYLFESLFDDELDDYGPRYQVYELPPAAVADLPGSWIGLSRLGTYVGAVDVSAVVFDPTRRSMLDAAVFDRLRR